MGFLTRQSLGEFLFLLFFFLLLSGFCLLVLLTPFYLDQTFPKAFSNLSARLSMAQVGSGWLSLAQLGSAWLNLAQLGSAGLSLAQLGSAWLSLAQLGSAWLSLAQLGSTQPGLTRFSIAIGSILALKFKRSPFCSNTFEFLTFFLILKMKSGLLLMIFQLQLVWVLS